MMEIDVISLGDVKEKYMQDLIKDYEKRISRFAKINLITLKDEPLRDSIDNVLNKEAIKIRQAIKPNSFVICLDIDGKNLDSVELSKKIEEVYTYNASKITFLIGGSYGILQSLKNECDFKLSFSKMTFPHQFMKGILLEQIYRSFKILGNESYHK